MSSMAIAVNAFPTPPAIETIGLRFRVSSEEEHVELTIRPRGDETEVPPRSFHYLLLTLARARLKGSDCAASEQGWVEREALCKMLRTDPTKLNVDVFRARRQLGEPGVLGAANLVERRDARPAARRSGPRGPAPPPGEELTAF